jgi:hypothetical protein
MSGCSGGLYVSPSIIDPFPLSLFLSCSACFPLISFLFHAVFVLEGLILDFEPMVGTVARCFLRAEQTTSLIRPFSQEAGQQHQHSVRLRVPRWY